MTSLPQGVRVREDFSDKGTFRLRAEVGVKVSWGRAGEEECSVLWEQQWKRRRDGALCLARPEGPVADSWLCMLMVGSRGRGCIEEPVWA